MKTSIRALVDDTIPSSVSHIFNEARLQAVYKPDEQLTVSYSLSSGNLCVRSAFEFQFLQIPIFPSSAFVDSALAEHVVCVEIEEPAFLLGSRESECYRGPGLYTYHSLRPVKCRERCVECCLFSWYYGCSVAAIPGALGTNGGVSVKNGDRAVVLLVVHVLSRVSVNL